MGGSKILKWENPQSIYADDSTYTISAYDPAELKETMDAKYQNIVQYMGTNKLVLNTEKTHVLIMASKRQHSNFGVTLNTGAEEIHPTPHEKQLGAIVSSDLEWNLHIRDHSNSLQRNLCSRLNAISKVCGVADFSTRKLIANGIFMSSLISLIQLWSGTSDMLLDSLQVAQNRTARLVTKLPLATSSETLLRQVGWLSVRQLSVFHSLTTVFNIKKSGKPLYLATKFRKVFPRQTRSAGGNAIHIEGKVTNNLRKNNFTFRAAEKWSSLPTDLRMIDSSSVFKYKLKEWVKLNVDR